METLSIAMLCWFAGTWDSTVYNRSEHPQTVALRFEVRDAETGLPVKDATLTLKGEYREERVGPSGDEFGKPHEPQPREFEMSTRTGAEGIAVFALGWKKIYPWDIGKPNQKDWQGNEVLGGVHISWTKAMDDIEKVQRIVIRHPRYREKMFKVNFNHLTDVGQEPDRQTQEPKVFEAFRNAWAEEMKREDVRCCVLNLGTQFKKFQNKQCTQSEFFEAIRDKRFGVVYTEPKNWFSFGDPPQSECGPYFVYLAEIGMEKTAGQIELVNDRSDNAEVRRRSRTINSEPAEDQTSAAKSQRSSERLAPGGRVAQAAERSVKARPEKLRCGAGSSDWIDG